MPTYVYCILNPDGSDGEQFELVQRMADPPLQRHPETGQPVRRVITLPNVAGQWSEASTRNKLSDSNLDRIGFTKYERGADGTYEKRAGPGPKKLQS